MGRRLVIACQRMLVVPAIFALAGCGGRDHLSAARVSVVRIEVLAGTSDGAPPPWRVAVVHDYDRRFPAWVEEGNYSDCGDPNVRCAPDRGHSRMPIDSLGFAGVPTATLAKLAVGESLQLIMPMFSARSVDDKYDTFSVRPAQGRDVRIRLTVLDRCDADLYSVTSSAYRGAGSGVIAVPRWQDIRWTELQASCLP